MPNKLYQFRSAGPEMDLAIDAARGDVPTSDWLRAVVQSTLDDISGGKPPEGTPKKGMAPGRGNPPTKAPPPAACAHERTRLSQVTGKVLCEKCGAVLR